MKKSFRNAALMLCIILTLTSCLSSCKKEQEVPYKPENAAMELKNEDGKVVGYLPDNIFEGFLATEDSSFEEILGNSDIYFGAFDDGARTWAIAASKPVSFQSTVNVYLTIPEASGNTVSRLYTDILPEPGVVVDAGYYSKEVGFISLERPDGDGFALCGTFKTDVWEMIDVPAPEGWSIENKLYLAGNDDDTGDNKYPFVLRNGEEETKIFLVSEDGGETFTWEEDK